MIRNTAIACALALLTAGPAFAQKDDLAGIDAAYNPVYAPCLAAHSDKAMPPEERLSTCQAALSNLDAFFAGRDARPHEVNIYRQVRGFLQLEIGGAYVAIDKVRSARVCSQTEGAWTELALIADGESPAAYQKAFAEMRAGVHDAVGKCRSEFGTPSGAAPLP